jgi:hypothetical protein
MPNCVTCGDQLHPERAEKYDYCTKPKCQKVNSKGLRIVAVGVNKAADQYMALDERTEREMASGRFKKQPEVPASARVPPRSRSLANPAPRPRPVVRQSSTASRPRWSESQENLALIYRGMGLRPDQIAKKLGMSPYLVTQILLEATARGRR